MHTSLDNHATAGVNILAGKCCAVLTLSHAMPCCAMLSHAMLCHAVLSCAVIWRAVLHATVHAKRLLGWHMHAAGIVTDVLCRCRSGSVKAYRESTWTP